MAVITDDIIWSASIKALRRDFRVRIARLKLSVASLKNQTGLYADEHRAMISLYDDIATAIDVHDRQRATPGPKARKAE